MIRPCTINGQSLTSLWRHPRRGTLLLEVTMATLLLMVAMSLTVRVLGWVGQERRSAERRQRAVIEVANAMERISAYPYEQVSGEFVRKLLQESSADRTLPEAEWKTSVDESNPGPGRAAKRILLRLRWKNRFLEWESPVGLTTWIERRSNQR
jgi:hypothetical protein